MSSTVCMTACVFWDVYTPLPAEWLQAEPVALSINIPVAPPLVEVYREKAINHRNPHEAHSKWPLLLKLWLLCLSMSSQMV
jgi:hypothetical protein